MKDKTICAIIWIMVAISCYCLYVVTHDVGVLYECEIIASHGRETNAPDMYTVGYNADKKAILICAHGGQNGELHLYDSTQEGVDYILSKINTTGLECDHIELYCCYPRSHNGSKSMLLNVNIVPFSNANHVCYGSERKNGIYMIDNDIYWFLRDGKDDILHQSTLYCDYEMGGIDAVLYDLGLLDLR